MLNHAKQKDIALSILNQLAVESGNDNVKVFANLLKAGLITLHNGDDFDADGITKEEFFNAVETVRSKGVFPMLAVYGRYSFGKCLSFVCVSKYEEDDSTFHKYGDNIYVFHCCYVVNLTEPDFSEFGTCAFELDESGFFTRVS